MKKIIYISIFYLLAFPVLSDSVNEDLFGRWEFTPEFSEMVPEGCKNGYIEIDSREFILISGEQIIYAHYESSSKDNEIVLALTNLRSNGESNCQGFSAEFVLKNFFTLQTWRKKSRSVEVFAPDLIMELHRVETP